MIAVILFDVINILKSRKLERTQEHNNPFELLRFTYLLSNWLFAQFY